MILFVNGIGTTTKPPVENPPKRNNKNNSFHSIKIE